MSSASVGVPPAVATLTASPKVIVAVNTSPTFRVPFWMPRAPLRATPLTAGAVVSRVSAKAALCAPTLPAASTQA